MVIPTSGWRRRRNRSSERRRIATMRRCSGGTCGRLWASRPASKIEPLEIQGLYADMQERGLSARTVRFTHAVLRSALQQAVKLKLIPQNAALSVDLPKHMKGEIQVLNPQQATDFLKDAAQDPYHVLFTVALTTG